MAGHKQICRLCLDTSDGFEILEHNKTEMLNKISLNLELTLTDKPLICFKCWDVLQRLHDFKINCLQHEKYLRTFLNCDRNVKLNLKEIIKRDVMKNEAESEENVCRFCLKYLNQVSFVKFSIEEDLFLRDILHKCLPEIELGITDQPAMCNDCLENCENMFEFISNCLRNDERIKEYTWTNSTASDSQISLSDVVDFIHDTKNETVGDVINIKKEKLDPMDEAEACINNDFLYVSCGVEIKNEVIEDVDNPDILRGYSKDTSSDEAIKEEHLDETRINNSDNGLLDEANSNLTTFRCTACSYESKYKGNIRIHMLVHKDKTQVRIYKCTECDYEGKHKSNLNRHMLTHKSESEVMMQTCTECDYKSKHKRNLRKHMLSHKDSSEVVMHNCPECSYGTKHKSNLQKHLLTHRDSSEVMMHKCTQCSFESRYKRNLQKHILLHKDNSEVTMYRCTECAYESKFRGNLQKHVLVHKDNSEVPMYRCADCSYESKHKCYIRKHVLTHKNNSQMDTYRCTECSFESKHRSGLKNHMLVHKDQKILLENPELVHK